MEAFYRSHWEVLMRFHILEVLVWEIESEGEKTRELTYNDTHRKSWREVKEEDSAKEARSAAQTSGALGIEQKQGI